MSVATVLAKALFELDIESSIHMRIMEIKREWRAAVSAGDRTLAIWLEREMLVWRQASGEYVGEFRGECPVHAAASVTRIIRALKERGL